MKNTKRNIALWALLSTQLLTAEPAVAQNVVNRKEDLVENLKTTEDSMNSSILKIIENNKNEIAYFTKQETKVYSDSTTKQELCTIPAWTYFRKVQIDQDNSNENYTCFSIKDKKVWINNKSLEASTDNLLLKYLKPKTEKSIVVDKVNRKMSVYDQYGKRLLKEFSIALSPFEKWDKTIEWDGNTPEGKYYVCYKNPASSFWTNPNTGGRLWSLQVSYPNTQDAVEWLISWDITKSEYQWIKNSIQQKKIPSQWTSLGNYIMVHWWGSEYDRTLGCMGLNNGDMLRLYNNITSWTDMFIW